MAHAYVIAIAVLATCLGCGSAPTAPGSNELVSISIAPAAVQVGVGTSLQLAARGRYSNGSTAVVDVAWSVTPNNVATISSSGLLVGLRLGKAAISAVHSSGASAAAPAEIIGDPAIPIPPQTSLSGVWQGRYLLNSCIHVSGAGPSVCRFVLGATWPIGLQLTESNGRVTGRLTLYDSASGDVSGWRDAFTRHVLFGQLLGEGDLSGRTIEITRWDGQAVDGQEITGSFEISEKFTSPAFGPQIYLQGGSFVGFRRQSGVSE